MGWLVVLLLLQDEEPKQDQEPKKEKPVVVTASPLNPKDVRDTPSSSEVLGSENFRERAVRTLPAALQETVGGHVQKTAYGHGSPVIRGFTGFRNVFLIDGIRLNHSAFREGPNQYWNTVDSFLIDRLEIVRGPGSVLYGSDSIGGTVVAYTAEPWEWEPGFHVNDRSFYRFASAEESYVTRDNVWGNWGDFGFQFGATFRDYNDLDGGKRVGAMPETGYDEVDADAKFAWRINERMRLLFAYQRTRQDDVPRTHATVFSKPWHGSAAGTDLQRKFDQERDLAYVQFHWAEEGAFIDRISVSLSWHRHAEEFTRRTSSNRLESRDLEIEQPGAWLRAGKKTSFGFFTAGAEFYREEIESGGKDVPATSAATYFSRGDIADDATYTTIGAYLQYEHTLFEHLDLTAGIRYSRSSVDAEEVDPLPNDAVVFDDLDDSYSAVVGSLRLLYHLGEHWNLIAGWGMGFRAPSLDDSTAIKLTLSGALDLPADDLDPEKSHTIDAGARAFYEFEDWGFEASFFYWRTFLRDFIGRVSANTDFNGDGITDNTKDNFAGGFAHGVEFQAKVTLFKDWTVWGDFAWTIGESDVLIGTRKTERPLAKMAPATGHLGVRWQKPDGPWWVEGVITMARHQDRLAPTEDGDISNDFQRIPPGGTPGYTVATIRGGWNACKYASIFVAVENITNKDYRTHGSGQNEAGTNFVAALELRF